MLLAVGSGAAVARDDDAYFQQLERERHSRASEEQWFDRMRQGWHERAREREILRQERVPAIKKAIPPSDRLSSKLYSPQPPLGHIAPRAETGADVNRDVFAPSDERLVPKALWEFERRKNERRGR